MFLRLWILALTGLSACTLSVAGILPSPNPNRAYPPSCLPGDVPQQPLAEAPSWSIAVPVFTTAAPPNNTETVAIKVWRVACSETKAALLLRVQRQSFLEGSAVRVAIPYVRIEQASTGLAFTDDVVRLAGETNTKTANAYPLRTSNSQTFVLEVQATAVARPDFNAPFRLRFDKSAGNYGTMFPGIALAVPAYTPTPATYPDAFLPQVISGYHGALYIQPNHPGFSLNIAVYDQADPDVKVVMAGWNFRDAAGQQWYLGQSGTIRPGDRRANIIQLMYNDGSLPVPLKWGDAVLEWDSCNTLRMTSTPYPDLPPGVPNQAKTETWTRVAPFNALPCE